MTPEDVPLAVVGGALGTVVVLFGGLLLFSGAGRVDGAETASRPVSASTADADPAPAIATTEPETPGTQETLQTQDTAPIPAFTEQPSAAAPAPSVSAVSVPGELIVTMGGHCTPTGGTLGARLTGFTADGEYRVAVLQPDGAGYLGTPTNGGSADGDGAFGWSWPCLGSRPGTWTAVFTDVTSDRAVTTAFTVGEASG